MNEFDEPNVGRKSQLYISLPLPLPPKKNKYESKNKYEWNQSSSPRVGFLISMAIGLGPRQLRETITEADRCQRALIVRRT
jgi:hypothetical protein